MSDGGGTSGSGAGSGTGRGGVGGGAGGANGSGSGGNGSGRSGIVMTVLPSCVPANSTSTRPDGLATDGQPRHPRRPAPCP